jgi:hypothetical protein
MMMSPTLMPIRNSMRFASGTSACARPFHAEIKSAAGCVHYAAKLSQQPITGVLDNTAVVFGNLGIDERA